MHLASAAAIVMLVAGASALVPARAQSPAEACRPGAAPTPQQTEGPYFTPGAPEKAVLIEPGMPGQPIELSGRVLTRDCRPVPQARVDLWQADAAGHYDNQGFRLRGHVTTDAEGRYRFRTVVPGYYPGRTRHFHIKVTAAGAPALTTQLYFVGESGNARDRLYRDDLALRTAKAGGDIAGRFDLIVDAR
jgi:protocatechuate 3,4-dioxygenase beta subunit